jgi:hypothetical protein
MAQRFPELLLGLAEVPLLEQRRALSEAFCRQG